jgi:protein-S-isoprenylcysteine O-methyltransferase Ste14
MKSYFHSVSPVTPLSARGLYRIPGSAVGVLLAALLVPPLLARVRAEEALLRAQFGGKYEPYCSRTSRLILIKANDTEGPV